jgi:UDP-glucuronate 4-epimerase
MQPGDVMKTYADISKISEFTGLSPKTSIEIGIDKFINWYLSFYSK